MNMHQIAENPKYLEKPKDNYNHNDNVQDSFDFVIHGDIPIDKP